MEQTEKEIEEFNSSKSRGERDCKSKYDKPEVIEFVIEEKNQGRGWTEIMNELQENGYPKISRPVIETLYNKGIARSITVSKKGGKQFTDYTQTLNDMYGKYVRVLERWLNAADKVTTKFEESDEVEPLQAALLVMKLSPQMRDVMKEVREAMTFNREQQEKIVLEQKNMIWSDEQINDRIGQILKKMPKEELLLLLKNKRE